MTRLILGFVIGIAVVVIGVIASPQNPPPWDPVVSMIAYDDGRLVSCYLKSGCWEKLK